MPIVQDGIDRRLLANPGELQVSWRVSGAPPVVSFQVGLVLAVRADFAGKVL